MRVPSPVMMTSRYSSSKNSLWFIMWLDAQESMYHTSFGLEVLNFVKLVFCFMMKAGPFSTRPEPSTYCDLYCLSELALLDSTLSKSTYFFQHSLYLWPFQPLYKQTVALFCRLLTPPWLPQFLKDPLLSAPSLCAYGSAHIVSHHCMPIHHVHHDHEAYLPPCTSSFRHAVTDTMSRD